MWNELSKIKPIKDGYYLTWCGANYCKHYVSWWGSFEHGRPYRFEGNIPLTHWMPLPEPPNAEHAEGANLQELTAVKTTAAHTPEGEILCALYYACCEADAHGELSEYIDGSLLDRAKLLLTA